MLVCNIACIYAEHQIKNRVAISKLDLWLNCKSKNVCKFSQDFNLQKFAEYFQENFLEKITDFLLPFIMILAIRANINILKGILVLCYREQVSVLSKKN